MATVQLSLGTKEISNLIARLKKYRDKTLPKLCKQFVEELANVGIETARSTNGKYSSYIEFKKEIHSAYDSIGVVKAVVIGADIAPLLVQWRGKGGKPTGYTVSPIALEEFGSGWESDVLFASMQGIVGQGTMPNAKGHAFDPMGWGWQDLDGTYHRSIGYAPTHPMYNAWIEMLTQIRQIADKVFQGGLDNGY